MPSDRILQNKAPTGHAEKLLADTSFQSYMSDSLFQKKGLEGFYQIMNPPGILRNIVALTKG